MEYTTVLASILAGLATVIAAYLSQLTSPRQRREREARRQELERLVGLASTDEAAKKAAVLERVVERIPVGLTPDQFKNLVVEITSRLPPTAGAVETLITNYHEQALGQAKAQFWFSVAAATIGFVWILWTGSAIDPANATTAARTLPGVIMDAAAFLFFRQASETRQRATELYDRLRRDMQMGESAALVASIEDLRLRSAVKAQLALHMSGLAPTAIDLGAFLSRDSGAPGVSVERAPSNKELTSGDGEAAAARS